MNPELQNATVQPAAEGTVARPTAFARWHRRILGFCLIVFALELGVFLLVFPWTFWWELSWIPVHSPEWNDLWMSGYFRGAVSGLGLLDLYVAFGELFAQLKAIFISGS